MITALLQWLGWSDPMHVPMTDERRRMIVDQEIRGPQ